MHSKASIHGSLPYGKGGLGAQHMVTLNDVWRRAQGTAGIIVFCFRELAKIHGTPRKRSSMKITESHGHPEIP